MTDDQAATAFERDRSAGRLVLVATPIGNLGDLSLRATELLRDADVICCEDTRRTGLMLHNLGITDRRLLSVHTHNEASRVEELLVMLENGALVALVADAGTPLVSDPGERLVRAAIGAGVEITAIPGPSAAIVALSLSGFPLERWSFEGFLPRKGTERRERLSEIAASHSPTVCYEAPSRIRATVKDFLEVCGGERRIAIARELTKLHEEVWRGSLTDAHEWVEARPIRGEFVLVVDGAPRDVRGSVATDLAVRRLLEAGFTSKQAVSVLVALGGTRRRDAYTAALELEKERASAKPDLPARDGALVDDES